MAVLRIFDVLARVQERSAIKAAVHIPGVRNIVSLDDPGDSHVGIVCGFDGNGNVLIIHCASGANNVVVTSKEGFTAVSRPFYYSK